MHMSPLNACTPCRRDERLEKTHATVGYVIGIVGFQVLEKELLCFVFFDLIVASDLLERLFGCLFIDAEELARFDPFVLGDKTIVIQIEHVERCIDALGELLENLWIRVGLAQLIGQILMIIEPFI